MKNYLFILTFIVAISACKKDQSNKPDNIVGKWELRAFNTGWMIPKKYEPGNGNKFIFNWTGGYTKYVDNKINTQGQYKLSLFDEHENVKYGKIMLTNPDYSDVYSVKNDTLFLGTSVADGPSWQYVRVK